ncbi:MAG: guanylate kinase [Lachnospiraceae bacterium]|nr:guanylate kinase [Candidatus Merdinaster equi]
MGRIVYVMGKSSSGKDTIYKALLANKELALSPVVLYTTRPIREGERDGVEYHFTDEAGKNLLEEAGKVIESRTYHTVHGDWTYFTSSEGIDLAAGDYAVIGTPESYVKVRDYYGDDKVLPIYIELDDGVRLQRALDREKKEEAPKYKELCRRFLADSEDFSEEVLGTLGLERRFYNDNLDLCIAQITEYIFEKK